MLPEREQFTPQDVVPYQTDSEVGISPEIQKFLEQQALEYRKKIGIPFNENGMEKAIAVIKAAFATGVSISRQIPNTALEAKVILDRGFEKRQEETARFNVMLNNLEHGGGKPYYWDLGIFKETIVQAKNELNTASQKPYFSVCMKLENLAKHRRIMLSKASARALFLWTGETDYADYELIARYAPNSSKQSMIARGMVVSSLVYELSKGEKRPDPFFLSDDVLSAVDRYGSKIRLRDEYKLDQSAENAINRTIESLFAGNIPAGSQLDSYRMFFRDLLIQSLDQVNYWAKTNENRKGPDKIGIFRYWQKKYQVLFGLPIHSLIKGEQFVYKSDQVDNAIKTGAQHLWQNSHELGGYLIPDPSDLEQGYRLLAMTNYKENDPESRRLERAMDAWRQFQDTIKPGFLVRRDKLEAKRSELRRRIAGKLGGVDKDELTSQKNKVKDLEKQLNFYHKTINNPQAGYAVTDRAPSNRRKLNLKDQELVIDFREAITIELDNVQNRITDLAASVLSENWANVILRLNQIDTGITETMAPGLDKQIDILQQVVKQMVVTPGLLPEILRRNLSFVKQYIHERMNYAVANYPNRQIPERYVHAWSYMNNMTYFYAPVLQEPFRAWIYNDLIARVSRLKDFRSQHERKNELLRLAEYFRQDDMSKADLDMAINAAESILGSDAPFFASKELNLKGNKFKSVKIKHYLGARRLIQAYWSYGNKTFFINSIDHLDAIVANELTLPNRRNIKLQDFLTLLRDNLNNPIVNPGVFQGYLGDFMKVVRGRFELVDALVSLDATGENLRINSMALEDMTQRYQVEMTKAKLSSLETQIDSQNNMYENAVEKLLQVMVSFGLAIKKP